MTRRPTSTDRWLPIVRLGLRRMATAGRAAVDRGQFVRGELSRSLPRLSSWPTTV
jgi:hypothetical protein